MLPVEVVGQILAEKCETVKELKDAIKALRISNADERSAIHHAWLSGRWGQSILHGEPLVLGNHTNWMGEPRHRTPRRFLPVCFCCCC